MANFHLTPKGQARSCSAQSPASCRYSQEAGEIVKHYSTKEEAQAAYEKQASEQHGTTNTLTKKKVKKESSNETIASEYFDKNLAKFSQGFPQEIIDQQKQRYIKDAMANENALAELIEWDKDRKNAADFFDNNQRKFYKGFPDEVIEKQKQQYIDDILNNNEAAEQLRNVSNDDVPPLKANEFKDNGDTVYKGVAVIENEVIYDGVKFTRLNEKNVIDTPYSIRVQVGKELTEAEALKVSQLFGYEYAKTGGERGNHFEQDSPNSIIVYADTTKGRSYRRLDDFVEGLPKALSEGTPVRKTDKAGAGTRGTRLVDGLGDLGYVELYADDTYSMDD